MTQSENTDEEAPPTMKRTWTRETLLEPREPLNVDELLENEVGCMGLWQWLTAILIMLSNPPTPTYPVFANSIPKQRCLLQPTLENTLDRYNLTFMQSARVVGPWKSGKSKEAILYNGCSRYDINWTEVMLEERIKNITQFNDSTITYDFPTIACPEGYRFYFAPDQYHGSVVSEFETVCEEQWLVPMGTSVFMFGMMFGFIFGGWAGDLFGRKRTSLVLALIELIGTIATSAAPNYPVYIIARAVVGAANLGKYTTLNILVMECTLARYRVFFHATVSIGYNFILRGLISLEAYFIPNWRYLNAAVMAPNLLCLVHLIALCESPRWLVSQNKRLQALKALSFGRRINRFIGFGSVEGGGKLKEMLDEENEREIASKQFLNLDTKDVSGGFVGAFQGFYQTFSSWALAKTTILGIILFSGEAMAYFGMLLYARQIKGSIYLVTFINASTAIPALMMSTFLYRTVRFRRPPLIGIYIVSFVVLLSGGLYTYLKTDSDEMVLVVCGNLALVFLGSALSMLYVYIPELFPSAMRTQGFGIIAGLGRIGSILCTFVNETDSYIGHGVPLLIYAGVMVMQLVMLGFISDTSGENLPDFLDNKPEREVSTDFDTVTEMRDTQSVELNDMN